MGLDRAAVLTGLIAGGLCIGTTSAAAEDGSQSYLQHCAACHLENGQGVPSAFPPLDTRIGRWAVTDAGRNYLVGVVSNGLFGSITVDGIQYVGAMPQMRHIDPAQIAAALSYVVTVFGGAADASFSTEELISRRDQIGTAQSHSLRPGD